MAKIKVREIGFDSPIKKPLAKPARKDEIPHWRVWHFALRTGKRWYK